MTECFRCHGAPLCIAAGHPPDLPGWQPDYRAASFMQVATATTRREGSGDEAFNMVNRVMARDLKASATTGTNPKPVGRRTPRRGCPGAGWHTAVTGSDVIVNGCWSLQSPYRAGRPVGDPGFRAVSDRGGEAQVGNAHEHFASLTFQRPASVTTDPLG